MLAGLVQPHDDLSLPEIATRKVKHIYSGCFDDTADLGQGVLRNWLANTYGLSAFRCREWTAPGLPEALTPERKGLQCVRQRTN